MMINVVYKNVALYRSRQINNYKCDRCHKKALVGREQFYLSKGDQEVFMDKLTLELDQSFSGGWNFVPQGTLGNIWRYFWLSHWERERDCYWHRVGRYQGHPAKHKTALPKQRINQLKISIVSKLRNPELDLKRLMRIFLPPRWPP